MKPKQLSLWEAQRMNMHDSIRLSLESLRLHVPKHKRLVIMFSGGKDSAAMMTFVLWAILTEQVPPFEEAGQLLLDVFEEDESEDALVQLGVRRGAA